MRFCRAGGWLVICPYLVACGGDSEPNARSVVAQESESSADTLMLLATATISTSGTAQYVDAAQLDSIGLRIDGEDWGVYAADVPIGTSTGSSVEGWSVGPEPSQALFVAQLGQGAGAVGVDRGPETAGAWASVMQKQ